MTNVLLKTVANHPKWLASDAKLTELNQELYDLNKRAAVLTEAIAAIPKNHNISAGALELLGDCVPGTAASQIAAGQKSVAELAEVNTRIKTVEQAANLLRLRMYGDAGGPCLQIDLSREVCKSNHGEYARLVGDVRDAVVALKAKSVAMLDFIDALEDGNTTVVGPLEKIGNREVLAMFDHWTREVLGEYLDKSTETAQEPAELETV